MVSCANTHQNRVTKIRQLMKTQGVDAFIIPSSDPHMSEYLPAYWQGRQWVSGFTGSVGTLVITQDFAGLWTDSRYWVQAPIQLADTGIELQKMEQGRPTFGKFLAETLVSGAKVAIDGSVLSVAEFENLIQIFKDKKIELITELDLLMEAWDDRPSLPNEAVYPHPREFIDGTSAQKLAKVRAKMSEKKADFHLISSLDDIAWLMDLRGGDVPFNPVFLSHLLIGKDGAVLFVDEQKLNEDTKIALNNAGIVTANYATVTTALADVAGTLLIDPAKVAISTIKQVSSSVNIVRAMNPSTVLKAVKSDIELNHVREAMRQDGAALCEFFARFEQKIQAGQNVSELDIDVMLNDARSRQPNHVSASFDTIAGFGANGAIVHYQATPERFFDIKGDGLLLIDSGAQYYNGTTDITRMAGVGKISDDEKRDVTYVLKAHIALAKAYYPVGISSAQLDVLARNQLWQQGLNYGHGTGHGVGYFLNVHEGPQVISYTAPASPERTMQLGMITSNEPGLYREGRWGIRLENLVATVPAFSTEFGEFAKFEDLTLCPFDTRLIMPELLTAEEKEWLNSYHQKVHDELIDRVDGDAKAWLIARTQMV